MKTQYLKNLYLRVLDGIGGEVLFGSSLNYVGKLNLSFPVLR